MRSIQYLLILISFLLSYAVQNFWSASIIIYLFLVLTHQIKWYYADNRRLIFLILFISYLILFLKFKLDPHFDFFLLMVYMIDLYSIFEEKKALVAGLVSLLILFIYSLFQSIMIDPSHLAFYLCAWAFIHLIAKLKREQQDLIEKSFQWQIQEHELRTQQSHMIAQEKTLQEVRTLQERNRLSRDIHDSAGHVLSTVIIQLDAIALLSQDPLPQVAEMAHHLRDFTQKGLQEVRQIVHSMKPIHYDRVSFIEKLQQVMDDFQNHSHIHLLFYYNDALFSLTHEQQEALYRAVQEFLANTAKHAHASQIQINMHFTDKSLIFTMEDNGRGTDQIVHSVGLTGLQERIELVGGKLQHFTSKGKGFRTRIVLYRKD